MNATVKEAGTGERERERDASRRATTGAAASDDSGTLIAFITTKTTTPRRTRMAGANTNKTR